MFGFVATSYVHYTSANFRDERSICISKSFQTCWEGVEINPGPLNGNLNYVIRKVVQVPHYQGNSKYGESAGMRRTSNAYFAINFSAFKSIDIW